MAAGKLDDGVLFDEATPLRPWTPIEAVHHMSAIVRADGTPVRWAVAGGWALDLFLGRKTRPHEDLEIVVLGDDAAGVLDAFRDPLWRWSVPLEGWLYPLSSPAFGESHQTWLWSEAAEIVMLFKAKHSRAKDVADLHAVLPALDDDQRRWLRRSLRQVHPGHAWLDQV